MSIIMGTLLIVIVTNMSYHPNDAPHSAVGLFLSGPTSWNTLSDDLGDSDRSSESFRRTLKPVLFLVLHTGHYSAYRYDALYTFTIDIDCGMHSCHDLLPL